MAAKLIGLCFARRSSAMDGAMNTRGVVMEAVYISIEKNIAVFNEYKKLWSSRGIGGICVDSMTEGIETAIAIGQSNTECLYFIDIVADEIDFILLLPLLDEAVDAPILIATPKSNYTEDEHHRALNNGAYFYEPYCDDLEKNINGVIAAVNSYHRVTKKQKTPSDILSCGGILISLSQHKAYVHDMFVPLTPQEFEVLHILILNAGKVLTYGEIYRHIHNGEYDDETARLYITPQNGCAVNYGKLQIGTIYYLSMMLDIPSL